MSLKARLEEEGLVQIEQAQQVGRMAPDHGAALALGARLRARQHQRLVRPRPAAAGT